MKAISYDQKVLLIRRQKARRRKELRQSGALSHERYIKAAIIASENVPRKYLAPACFRLTSKDERAKLIEFIGTVEAALASGRKVILDFRDTDDLHPCGTLYFIAHIDVLLEKYPSQISCRHPRDEVVEQLFQHVGLLQKFGHSPRLAITAENVINWHYAAGTDATTNAFKALLMQHEAAMGGLVTRSELYDCMSEAVTNTRKHAYPHHDDEVSRWWMFSQADEETLTVAICDLGIGIPNSLLQKKEMSDFIRKLFMIGSPHKHEKTLIQIATSSKRTSTGLPYRGKGLPQMLDFIKKGDVGGFRAQSGFGCYNYDAELKKGKAIAYRHPIRGTLIQWTLPLNT